MPPRPFSIASQIQPALGLAPSNARWRMNVACVFLAACTSSTWLSAQEPSVKSAAKSSDQVVDKSAEKGADNNALKPAITSERSANSAAPELESGFAWLFDGKSLDGWEGKPAWFRVEDQAIVAGSLEEKIPNNEFLCSKKTYDDFELRLQVRLKGEGNNAGVQFRSARVPNDHEVSGYQCDVGAAFGRSVWGALYDESRRNKMLAEGPAANVANWTKVGQWNDLWIRCQADRIQVWLNEHPTVDYRETDAKLPRTGVLGLQIHSGPPTEAWYRAIRIRPLKKDA